MNIEQSNKKVISPILEQGPTRGAYNRLHGLPPDNVVVVKGKGGIFALNMEARVGRLDILTQQYDYYTIVSTSHYNVTRHEVLSSNETTIKFELKIQMDLSVADPVEFVRQWPNGSIEDPIYGGLRTRLAQTVRAYSPGQVIQLADVLYTLSSDAARHQTSIASIAIHNIEVDVDIDDRGKDMLRGLSIKDLVRHYGEDSLLAMANMAEDPAEKARYKDLYAQLRKHDSDTRQEELNSFDRFSDWVNTQFGDDPTTVHQLLNNQELIDNITPQFRQKSNPGPQQYSPISKLLPEDSVSKEPPKKLVDDS